MSIPITGCLLSKAAFGDQKAFVLLVEYMDYNLRFGSMTIGGCHHKPPCQIPTMEQFEALDRRLAMALSELRKKESKPKVCAEGQKTNTDPAM